MTEKRLSSVHPGEILLERVLCTFAQKCVIGSVLFLLGQAAPSRLRSYLKFQICLMGKLKNRRRSRLNETGLAQRILKVFQFLPMTINDVT